MQYFFNFFFWVLLMTLAVGAVLNTKAGRGLVGDFNKRIKVEDAEKQKRIFGEKSLGYNDSLDDRSRVLDEKMDKQQQDVERAQERQQSAQERAEAQRQRMQAQMDRMKK
ncbi:MAG: hypothetical protein HQL18_02710 [Candidatus Omnitrophica bacterium]|nr:hypothetical protein [Candidatus Omnitrophota bacterium]